MEAIQIDSAMPGPRITLITKEELKVKMRSGKPVQIVNVLDPELHNLGFIKGSKGIPFHELDSRLSELDRSEEVVTYCASSECSASKHAAKFLAGEGFRVTAYDGGIKEWKDAGLPVEKGMSF